MNGMTLDDTATGTVVAEELAAAMGRHGIEYAMCELRPCGHIALGFDNERAASALLTFAVPYGGPSSLMDRSCGGLLTLTELHDNDVPSDDPRALAAFASGWAWTCYPEFAQHGIDWHVAVDLPVADAAEMTAILNAEVRP